jgi:hypothetical protein
MDRDTIICLGQGGNWMPSSSASCSTDPARYLPQCVGSWNVFMDSCLVDASTCVASEGSWQGGMHGWQISDSKIRMKGPAIHAFDIHGSMVVRSTLEGVNGTAVRWTDEYGRPLWQAGDMNFCQNTVLGTIYTAPTLAAVPGAVVSNCQPAPSPTPAPTPTPSPSPTAVPSPSTAPGDTVRINVTGPAVITVTK